MHILKEDQFRNLSITYEDHPEHKCLWLRLHGSYDVKCSEKVLCEASRLMKELNYQRFTLDLDDAICDMTPTDIFHQVELWKEAGVSTQCRIACISGKEENRENLIFLDNVFYNRGWKIRRCLDLEDVIDWVNQPDDVGPYNELAPQWYS